MNNTNSMDSRLRSQFSIRAQTFDHSANWMLDRDLLAAHTRALGNPLHGKNQVLDLCCGTGIVGEAMASKGWIPTGVDITPEMVSVAATKMKAVVGKVEELPFADSSFDACVLRQSFMLLDGERSLREIHRILKPGGIFIFSQSIAFSPEDEPHYRLVQQSRHINMLTYYDRSDFTPLFSRHGFKEEGREELSVRESSTKWMSRAPELSPEQRQKILNLIAEGPAPYRNTRGVKVESGEVFENWNWLVLRMSKL